jgi:hypothetical protein
MAVRQKLKKNSQFQSEFCQKPSKSFCGFFELCIQCHLDLVTLNLVTNCDLETI